MKNSVIFTHAAEGATSSFDNHKCDLVSCRYDLPVLTIYSLSVSILVPLTIAYSISFLKFLNSPVALNSNSQDVACMLLHPTCRL